MVKIFKSRYGHHLYMTTSAEEVREIIDDTIFEELWFHLKDQDSPYIFIRLPNMAFNLYTIRFQIVDEVAQMLRLLSLHNKDTGPIDILYTTSKNIKSIYNFDRGDVAVHNNGALVVKKGILFRPKLVEKTIDNFVNMKVKPKKVKRNKQLERHMKKYEIKKNRFKPKSKDGKMQETFELDPKFNDFTAAFAKNKTST